jgi:AcrR family transcriptional regulator
VMENQPTVTIPAPIRVAPVQARSTARVNALLDAACETMHEVGYEQLTTAMVAERSGASIGTVYRYFPDRIAVLQAVAARNLEHVLVALRENMAQASVGNLSDAMTVAVDTLVEVFASVKGFRSLRVGDVLDIRPIPSGRQGNAAIAEAMREALQARSNLRLDSAGRLGVESAVDVIDALLGRAFLHSERGDNTLIAEAHRVAQASVQGISS